MIALGFLLRFVPKQNESEIVFLFYEDDVLYIINFFLDKKVAKNQDCFLKPSTHLQKPSSAGGSPPTVGAIQTSLSFRKCSNSFKKRSV